MSILEPLKNCLKSISEDFMSFRSIEHYIN